MSCFLSGISRFFLEVSDPLCPLLSPAGQSIGMSPLEPRQRSHFSTRPSADCVIVLLLLPSPTVPLIKDFGSSAFEVLTRASPSIARPPSGTIVTSLRFWSPPVPPRKVPDLRFFSGVFPLHSPYHCGRLAGLQEHSAVVSWMNVPILPFFNPHGYHEGSLNFGQMLSRRRRMWFRVHFFIAVSKVCYLVRSRTDRSLFRPGDLLSACRHQSPVDLSLSFFFAEARPLFKRSASPLSSFVLSNIGSFPHRAPWKG